MNTIQAAIAEIVAEALRDAAVDLDRRAQGGTAFNAAADVLRARANRVAAGLTP